MSDKRQGLPDWWKWVPSTAWLAPGGEREAVVRDGACTAVAYKGGSYSIFFKEHNTMLESSGHGSIDEAKDACERAYLALVGVVGKGGG